MDYIVADRSLIPVKTQKYFHEKQIYLPNSYLPTDNTVLFRITSYRMIGFA